MDCPVDSNFKSRQRLKRAACAAAALLVLSVLFGFGPRWIRPAVSRDDIRTALVETGPIEATLSASGTVVPEFEQVLSSPLDVRVVKILKKPGAVLRKGEPILDLDVSESELSLDKLVESLRIKENEQAQRRLDLENTLISKHSFDFSLESQPGGPTQFSICF